MREQVSEFVILAPGSAHGALVYAKERLRCYLAGRFPEYQFSLAEMWGDHEEDAFVVVPVVGTVGDEENPGHLMAVNERVIVEIRQALEAFQLHASMLH